MIPVLSTHIKRHQVAEWEPRSGPSADEVRVEDGTKAKEMPKARVSDQEWLESARQVRVNT